MQFNVIPRTKSEPYGHIRRGGEGKYNFSK